MPKTRSSTEYRTQVVVFRMRPKKYASLTQLANAYGLKVADTIRQLLEPAIDAELEVLREKTSLRAAGLRERTRQAKLRLKGAAKTESKLSKMAG